MRIAQIVGPKIPFSPELPNTPYSIPAVSYLITEELVKRGHEVTVFAPSDSITSAKIAPGMLPTTYLKQHHLMEARTQGPNQKYRLLAHNHFQKAVDMSKDFDIIHNHELSFLYFAPLARAPVFTTLHYHVPDIKEREFLHVQNNKFIAISKKQTINFPALPFAGVIHHGIPVEKFPFNPKPKNYFSWLGRITEIKGCREAILAALLAQATLKVAGNIEWSERKTAYTKVVLGLLKKYKSILYMRKVGYEKKINLLKYSRATLMPILWEEPFGLVAVESLACGTPVIAFKRGALPEIIEHEKTGFLVNSMEEMSEAMKKIGQIKRADCRAAVEKYFYVGRMVDDYEKLFSEYLTQ